MFSVLIYITQPQRGEYLVSIGSNDGISANGWRWRRWRRRQDVGDDVGSEFLLLPPGLLPAMNHDNVLVRQLLPLPRVSHRHAAFAVVGLLDVFRASRRDHELGLALGARVLRNAEVRDQVAPDVESVPILGVAYSALIPVHLLVDPPKRERPALVSTETLGRKSRTQTVFHQYE